MVEKTKWKAKDIKDQHGKIVLITGANCGLGFESAKALAARDAEVIMACRDVEKGEQARQSILKSHATAHVKVMQLDVSDLASIKSFSEQFLKNYSHLDILLNNAGIMTTPFFRTKDGFEGQIGTNHFGHFALTLQLMPLIKKTPYARVVNVSSLAHLRCKLDFDNLNFENESKYTPMKAYKRSKLSNLLFTYELQRKFEQQGINAIAVVAHPGAALTELGRHIEARLKYFSWVKPAFALITNTPAMGALPQLYAATGSDVKGGDYYGPSGPGEVRGYPKRVQSTRYSRDKNVAKQLWEVSEQLTGLAF